MLEDEEQKIVADFHSSVDDMKVALDKIGSSRELSMVKTKLDEATMWMKAHFKL